MAFIDRKRLDFEINEASRYALNVSGNLMAVLMGHGYRESNESHMKPIMDAWEQHTSPVNRGRKSNKAMRTGLEMEQIATRYMSEMLRLGSREFKNEAYKHARMNEANRGLYLEEAAADHSYACVAVVDGPLQDIRGSYKDPRSGEVIPGALYIERQAQEKRIIDRRIQDNELLEADGEDCLPIPLAKYTENVPLLGCLDITVTQSQRRLVENRLFGIPPGLVIKAHHTNELIRSENYRNGHDDMAFLNLMGVYQFCTEVMDGYFYEIEHDPELVDEMQRRLDVFLQCISDKTPPSSSKMQGHFFEYPITPSKPAAMVLEDGMNELFAPLVTKREAMIKRIAAIQEDVVELDSVLVQGWEQVNRESLSNEPKALIVQREGRESMLIDYSKSIYKTKDLNKAGLNSALISASHASDLLSNIREILVDGALSKDEIATKLISMKNDIDMAIAELPGRKATSLGDYEIITTQESEHAELKITESSRVQNQYERWQDRAWTKATEENQKPGAENHKKAEGITQGKSISSNGANVAAVEAEHSKEQEVDESSFKKGDSPEFSGSAFPPVTSEAYIDVAGGNPHDEGTPEQNSNFVTNDFRPGDIRTQHDENLEEDVVADEIGLPQHFPGF